MAEKLTFLPPLIFARKREKLLQIPIIAFQVYFTFQQKWCNGKIALEELEWDAPINAVSWIFYKLREEKENRIFALHFSPTQKIYHLKLKI